MCVRWPLCRVPFFFALVDLGRGYFGSFEIRVCRSSGIAINATTIYVSCVLTPLLRVPPSNTQTQVQPSAKREGFATVPGVSWSDVGALASVREELSLSILEPIAYPEVRKS